MRLKAIRWSGWLQHIPATILRGIWSAIVEDETSYRYFSYIVFAHKDMSEPQKEVIKEDGRQQLIKQLMEHYESVSEVKLEDGEKILAEILESQLEDEALSAVDKVLAASQPTTQTDEDGDEPRVTHPKSETTHTQWAINGNGMFSPVGATVAKLPSGVYEPFARPGMWGVEKINVASDGIHRLPDMATDLVLDEVAKFWSSEQKYREHNLLYKRGLILWGPPGGGKTVTVKLLMNELVKRDGIVIVAQQIQLTTMVLKAIRRIEPGRNIIVVLEDIDEIINFSGESVVLSMLDGENNIDNVLHIATTNYPERLGARIINRPSRFDRRVYVGMPGDAARRDYLDKTTKGALSSETLDKWVKDTGEDKENPIKHPGFSIAHLRELVAAVYCLEQPYEDVLKRLRDMATQVSSGDDFKRRGMGFKNKKSDNEWS